MSPVCVKCEKEMKCVKTGRVVRTLVLPHHCYAGDEFECPRCEMRVVVGFGGSFVDENVKDDDLFLDGS